MEEIKTLVYRFKNSSEQEERETLFREICDRYINLIHYAINDIAPQLLRERVEDVVQEIMVIVATELDGFVWESERKFNSWLYTIAVNKTREEARKAQRDGSIFVKEELNEQIPNSLDLNDDAILELFETWNQFDSEGFEINYIFHSEGKRDKDIADMLNISEEAARKKRTRAAKSFNAYLTREYGVSTINEWMEHFCTSN